MSGSPFKSVVQRVEVPQSGDVELTVETVPVTEKEIISDRNMIIARLDGCYNNVIDSMSEFQADWDEHPVKAIQLAAYEGLNSGASAWADDLGDLFDGEAWGEIGDSLGDFATATYDMAADYAANVYQGVKERIEKHINDAQTLADNPAETLLNWKWWVDQSEDFKDEFIQSINTQIDEAKESLGQMVSSVQEAVDDSVKIFQHRKAILELPQHMIDGNVNAVENFVDTVLFDIDPELAKDVKENPNYAYALQLVEDNDTLLSYMAYFSLVMEAIPPNFYVYAGAKGAAYLALELVLTVILGFFSAGVGVAARVGVITARFATAAAKTNKTLQKAQQAVEAYIRIFDDFILKAIKELQALGKKILIARSKGVRVTGSTGTKLSMRKKQMRRERGRCRVCKKKTHKTPSRRFGEVRVYKSSMTFADL